MLSVESDCRREEREKKYKRGRRCGVEKRVKRSVECERR